MQVSWKTVYTIKFLQSDVHYSHFIIFTKPYLYRVVWIPSHRLQLVPCMDMHIWFDFVCLRTYYNNHLSQWGLFIGKCTQSMIFLSRGGNVRNNSTFHQKLSNIPLYTLSKTVINNMKLKERAKITSSCAVEFFKLMYGKAAIAAHWCYIYTLPQWTTFWLKIENEMKLTMTWFEEQLWQTATIELMWIPLHNQKAVVISFTHNYSIPS